MKQSDRWARLALIFLPFIVLADLAHLGWATFFLGIGCLFCMAYSVWEKMGETDRGEKQ